MLYMLYWLCMQKYFYTALLLFAKKKALTMKLV